MQCDYSEIDWQCCLQKGHEGQHISKQIGPENNSIMGSAVPSDTDDAIAFIAENGRIVNAKSGTSQAYKEMIIDKCRNYMRLFSPEERGIAG